MLPCTFCSPGWLAAIPVKTIRGVWRIREYRDRDQPLCKGRIKMRGQIGGRGRRCGELEGQERRGGVRGMGRRGDVKLSTEKALRPLVAQASWRSPTKAPWSTRAATTGRGKVRGWALKGGGRASVGG